MSLDEVKELVLPFILEHDFKLKGISWEKEYGQKILRVLVDKTGGINVDDLALVNEYLAEKLDAIDQDMPEYMLEVSSPGVEAELKTKEDIADAVGSYVLAKTNDKEYLGDLLSFEDDVLTIRVNLKGRMKNYPVNYEDIKKIRLAVKF